MNDNQITGFPNTQPSEIPGQSIPPGGVDTNMIKGSYSISTFGYADNFDSTYSFILPFYIDQNVTAILQVYLNLLFQKYRAFSKASANESAHTHSVAIFNHYHSVTIDSHTHNINGTATDGDNSAHQHTILVQKDTWNDSPPNSQRIPIFVDSQGLPGPHGGCTNGDLGQLKANYYGREEPPQNNDISFKTNCTISSHTHPIASWATLNGGGSTPTSAAGGADTVASATGSAHTHALTFGIYESPSYPTSVGIKVDGVDRTTALGGLWNPSGGSPTVLNLDLTKYITTIGYHTLEIYTADIGRCIPLLWMKTQSKR